MEIDAEEAKQKLQKFSELMLPHMQRSLEAIGIGAGEEKNARKHVAGMFFTIAVADALQAGVPGQDLIKFLRDAVDNFVLGSLV